MPKPFVSVVIPTFNRGTSLPAAVQSVLAQTYRNLELIVVDDCSKVPVAETLKDIQDSRLRVIRHERNRKVGAARNTGAENARGTWLAFLDDDDFWRPDKLQKQLDYIQSKQGRVDACLTEFGLAGRQTLYRRRSLATDVDWSMVAGACLLMGSSMLVRRDVFERVGNFDVSLPRAEDWDWLLRYHNSGHKMGIVPGELTMYSGAHRGTPEEEADNVRRIVAKHGKDFRGNGRLSRTFRAAAGWKLARTEFAKRRYVSGTARLASTAACHPIHFGRYLRIVLAGPARHILRQGVPFQSLFRRDRSP